MRPTDAVSAKECMKLAWKDSRWFLIALICAIPASFYFCKFISEPDKFWMIFESFAYVMYPYLMFLGLIVYFGSFSRIWYKETPSQTKAREISLRNELNRKYPID